MPRELIAVAPRSPVLADYSDQPLQPGEIRVRSRFGAPKHGTEMHMYRGDSPLGDSHFDPTIRAFLPGQRTGGVFPIRLGNMCVGDVVEVGPNVEGVSLGDRVAGYGPLRETHRWAWGGPGVYPGPRKMPEGMTWQSAVCLDPTAVALGGIRDGGVRLGDRVAVSGLGAIGLMAVRLAKLAGASFVAAFEPVTSRREAGALLGADLLLDPTDVDAGMAIRRATGGKGVDVAIETSGNQHALHHAIRAVAFGGTVALIAWYNESRGGLDLGREAHFNRPTFVFTRAESEPHRDHPRWDHRRLVDTAWDLLATGEIPCEAIVQPVVAFDDVVQAYRDIDEHPHRTVKLGVYFGGQPG
jgi:threonine dehydrogenase-like Zn-dependent dehydrogenase